MSANPSHGPLALACALTMLAVAVPAATAAEPLRTAPAALPQMWAVELDGRALRAFDGRQARRARAVRAAVMLAPGARRAGKTRGLRRLARRRHLTVFAPRRARGPDAAAAACRAAIRAAPRSRCGVRARSVRAAVAMARRKSIDLVVVRARRPAALKRAARRLKTGRLLMTLALRNPGSPRLRRAMTAARRSERLDLAVRIRRPRALRRYLGRLDRRALGDRQPPRRPARLRVSRAAAHSARIAWKRRAGAVRYGVYRDGARTRSLRGRRARVARLECAGDALAVDAVDRAGNRSAKAHVRAVPAGCDSTGGPPQRSGSEDRLGDAEVPATRFVAPGGAAGGDCRREDPCDSLNRAFAAASPGEVVEVAAGRYPMQVIEAVPGRGGPSVTFRPARAARVVLEGLELGVRGQPERGPHHVTVRGMAMMYDTREPGAGNQQDIFVGPGTQHVRLEGMDAGSLYAGSADHLTVKGGDYGPCHAIDGESNLCGNFKLNASTNVLVDGATLHDFRLDESCLRPGANCHWECMFINGSRNVTIRNSKFRNCAYFDIFASVYGSDATPMGHKNLTIENNWFAAPWNDSLSPPRNTKAAVSLAWCENSPQGYQDVRVRFNSFQRNAALVFDNPPCRVENVQVVGNLMQYDGICDSRLTWRYNVWTDNWRSGTCSSTGAIAGSDFPYVAGGGQPGDFDYHLARGSAADRRVPVSAGCPVNDIDGQARPTAGVCDAGADER